VEDGAANGGGPGDLDRRAERETERASVARGEEGETRAAARWWNGMRVRVRGRGALAPVCLYMASVGRGVGRCPLPLPSACPGTGPHTGPACLPCRARAVPRAEVTAQARPGASGRAGMGTTTPGRAVPWAEPKPHAAGRASGPRAAWPSIP